jgi:hypothetical protein
MSELLDKFLNIPEKKGTQFKIEWVHSELQMMGFLGPLLCHALA